MLGRLSRLAILAEGSFTPMDAKTAVGVLRYRGGDVAIVAQPLVIMSSEAPMATPPAHPAGIHAVSPVPQRPISLSRRLDLVIIELDSEVAGSPRAAWLRLAKRTLERLALPADEAPPARRRRAA